MLSLGEYRQIALMSLWIGLIATVGVVFAFIPNVELVILTAFLGGVALGPKRGFIVAVIGEAIFSALNPIGSGLGFPLLFIFQIISVGLSGVVGGFLANIPSLIKNRIGIATILGLTGFLLTLVYDILTALSFPLSSGIVDGTIWGSILTGLVFFLMHLISTTLLFLLFAPVLMRLVKKQLLLHGLNND